MSLTTLDAGVNSAQQRPPTAAPVTKITYAMAQSALGRVLVAHSDAGVCAISLGDNDDDLADDLATQFPGSQLKVNGAALQSEMGKVLQFIGSSDDVLDFAIDMHGTPFQCRVWEALRAIPMGTTITYTELARRVGAPKAVRAVASACASNAIALAIPCHRVVRCGGALAGYRWGIERKQALLEMEARK